MSSSVAAQVNQTLGLPASTTWTANEHRRLGDWRFYEGPPGRSYAASGDRWVATGRGNGWAAFLVAGTPEEVAASIAWLGGRAPATVGKPDASVGAPSVTESSGTVSFTGWFTSPPDEVPEKLSITAPASGDARFEASRWSSSGPDIGPALTMLAEGDLDMRVKAVGRIAASSTAAATQALQGALKDMHPSVRGAAATALGGRAGSAAALDAAIRAETDAGAKAAEVQALVLSPDAEARAALDRIAASDPDPAIRSLAAGPH